MTDVLYPMWRKVLASSERASRRWTPAAHGSLFAGLLDGKALALEVEGHGRTAWQLDTVGARVRGRHWPDAVQVSADVREVDPDELLPVEGLTAGFSCKGVSTAGNGLLLGHPETRATYFGLLRFAGARPELLPWDEDHPDGLAVRVERDGRRRWLPEWLFVENTPRMISAMRPMIEAHLGALGYGCTWAMCEAADAGAPHLRRRAWLWAERGASGRGLVEVDKGGRWAPEGSEAEGGRPWATPSAGNFNEQENPVSFAARSAALQARGLPPVSEPLGQQVRCWPTAVAADAADVKHHRGGKSPALNLKARQPPRPDDAAFGKRLNPDWVECLMGVPVGWTLPAGPSLRDQLDRVRWPRGRYPADWDRTVPWPGFDWEPTRTLPDGAPVKGRPGRLRGLGNGVVWQQGALALRALLRGGSQ